MAISVMGGGCGSDVTSPIGTNINTMNKPVAAGFFQGGDLLACFMFGLSFGKVKVLPLTSSPREVTFGKFQKRRYWLVLEPIFLVVSIFIHIRLAGSE